MYKFANRDGKFTKDMYQERWDKERKERRNYFTHTIVGGENASITYEPKGPVVNGKILANKGDIVPENMIAEYEYIDGSCPFDTHEMSTCPEACEDGYIHNIAVTLYGQGIDKLECRLLYFSPEEAKELIKGLQRCLDTNKEKRHE